MWILLLMIVIMPLGELPYLTISNNFLGLFPHFTVIKLLGLVGLVWTLGQLVRGRVRLGLIASPAGKMFFVYLGFVLAAGVASGGEMRAFTRLLSITFFSLIVMAAVQSEQDVKNVIRTCVGVMVVVIPYAYYELLRSGGRLGAEVDERLGVGVYEPNYLALIFVLLTPFALALARQGAGVMQRILWFGGAGALAIGTIMTASRGGFLGLMVALLMFTFRVVQPRVATAATVLVSVLVLTLMLTTPLGDRLLASGFIPDRYNKGVTISNAARLSILQTGLRVIAEHPLFGVGPGKFHATSRVYSDFIDSRGGKLAHNTYLEIAAETGLPSLGVFLCFLGLLFRSLYRSARAAAERNLPHVYEWTIAMQAGVTGYLVAATFLSAQYEKFFWLITFLILALERILADAPATAPLTRKEAHRNTAGVKEAAWV